MCLPVSIISTPASVKGREFNMMMEMMEVMEVVEVMMMMEVYSTGGKLQLKCLHQSMQWILVMNLQKISEATNL